jgi:hypothetical protein
MEASVIKNPIVGQHRPLPAWLSSLKFFDVFRKNYNEVAVLSSIYRTSPRKGVFP